MDRHIWQRLATVVLAALIIFSVNTFSPVGNGDGFGITTTWAKKKAHQLPNPLDQQIAILVDLDINPNWVKEQSTADSLIYDTMKPDDTVPAGISEDYSYLVAGNRGKGISLFFKTDKRKATIRYTNYGKKLHTETVPSSRLVEQSYRIEK